MSKLFIIGNGFDLSHGLKSSYDDFREYLIKDTKIEQGYLVLPEAKQMPDGEILYNETDVLSLLFYLISEAESDNEKWSNIEESLGVLSFDNAFDYNDEVFDRDGDVDLWKTAYNNEDTASNLVIPTLTIQQLFSKWIDTITLEDVESKVDFLKLLGENNIFLNFNYTDTLEEIYEISRQKICYIHGRRDEEIYFGHGSIEDKIDFYMSNYIGSENYLVEIHEQLCKKTEDALNSNIEFFEGLTDIRIKEIYSYGFSFNEIDKIYLKEICFRLNTSEVKWYFNDYDKENHNEYINMLRKCGFKGEFNTFSINEAII